MRRTALACDLDRLMGSRSLFCFASVISTAFPSCNLARMLAYSFFLGRRRFLRFTSVTSAVGQSHLRRSKKSAHTKMPTMHNMLRLEAVENRTLWHN